MIPPPQRHPAAVLLPLTVLFVTRDVAAVIPPPSRTPPVLLPLTVLFVSVTSVSRRPRHRPAMFR